MNFQFVRKIGPKLTEIGMNFKFLLCQGETETPECFDPSGSRPGLVVLSPAITRQQCLGFENGATVPLGYWFSTASLAIQTYQRTDDPQTSPQQIFTALLEKSEFALVNLRILNQSGQGCQEPAKKLSRRSRS
jgi:hypothetical protein